MSKNEINRPTQFDLEKQNDMMKNFCDYHTKVQNEQI